MKSKQRKAKQQRRWARAAAERLTVYPPRVSRQRRVERFPEGWLRFSCFLKPVNPELPIRLCVDHQPLLDTAARLAARAYQNGRERDALIAEINAGIERRDDLRLKLQAATDGEAKATIALNEVRERLNASIAVHVSTLEDLATVQGKLEAARTERDGLMLELGRAQRQAEGAVARAEQAEAQVRTLQRLSAAKDLTITQLRADLEGPHETPWHARQMEIRRARYAMEQRRYPWRKRPAVVLGEYIPALEGLSPTAAGRVVVPLTMHNGGVA